MSITEKANLELSESCRVKSHPPHQMTTAQHPQLGDRSRSPSYYDYHYTPPVSPKSQPHGSKRKASSQDDESEIPSLISSTFKKLRLNKVAPHRKEEEDVFTADKETTQRPSATPFALIGVDHRKLTDSDSTSNHHPFQSYESAPYTNHVRHHEDDFMPLDDTADRIWIHDLDAEIAEIEAEEVRLRNEIQLSQVGKEASKIPHHLLKQHPPDDDPASSMQMVLYRDPISISVPEQEDAVRKTIIEARKRVREKQSQDQDNMSGCSKTPYAAPTQNVLDARLYDDAVDMDLD